MTAVRVEGWRGLSQSYAMVNQYQLLELMRRGVDVAHCDVPFHNPAWTAEKSSSGFDDARRKTIEAIPKADDNRAAAVTYRISFPFKYQPIKSGKLFVFGTSELQHIDSAVSPGMLQEGLANTGLKIVTPSHWSKIGFQKAGFDDSRIHVVPHGVDLNIYKPLDDESRARVRASLGLAASDFAILAVGGMSHPKGIDLLIIAYALLKQRYPHVRLVLKDASGLYGIAGARIFDVLRQSRPDLITEDLRATIIFISENLTLQQMSALYAAADCYASPYRAEGFNLPPLEAAACGTPIIVTKGGSTDDYAHPSFALQIEGQKLTFGRDTFIEPHIESLLANLTALIEGTAPAINRRTAVAHIAEAFSWSAVITKLLHVFAA